MSDEEDHGQLLVPAARSLVARTALVRRGIELADALRASEGRRLLDEARELMGSVCMHCRFLGKKAALEELQTLQATLDAMRSLPPSVQQEVIEPSNLASLKPSQLVQRRQLFELMGVGTRELQRLLEADSTRAARSLAYALHVIPRFLGSSSEQLDQTCPASLRQFDPTMYVHSLGIRADVWGESHWDEFSLEMREAFCNVVGASALARIDPLAHPAQSPKNTLDKLKNQTNVGIDPEMIGLAVELLGTYIEEGILTFKGAMQAFRDAHGRHPDMDPYFEAAWEEMEDEKVCVADVLRKAEGSRS